MNLSTTSQAGPAVLVYRDDLLGYSETFIADQALALRRFHPILVGIRSVRGLAVAHDAQLLAHSGRLERCRRIWTKLVGPARSRLRELAAFNATLIHAHFLIDAATAGQIAEALQIPMIVSVHGYDATVSDGGLLSMGCAERAYLLRRNSVLRRASQFLCVSHYLRGKLLAKGFPQEKLSVHYTGIDTEFFSPTQGSERLPRILFVGRLVEKKGCEYLIRAMEIVQARVPSAELTIIGDGPLRPQLEELARTKLRSFQFLGSQPREFVKAHMNLSTVFCVPSVIASSGDAEGFGMVFAEAQAMGLPVVSFATGGIPEAVEHGNTGFLAHERDYGQLAEFIAVLLTNPSLWRHMSETGQARVRRMFDIRRQTSKLEQIYTDFSSLLARKAVNAFDLREAFEHRP